MTLPTEVLWTIISACVAQVIVLAYVAGKRDRTLHKLEADVAALRRNVHAMNNILQRFLLSHEEWELAEDASKASEMGEESE